MTLDSSLPTLITFRCPKVSSLWASGLPKSKKTCDEKYDNNNTNDVKNIAHVNFSFLGVAASPSIFQLIMTKAYGVPITLGKM
jgi:hypothetical protein